MASDIMRYRDAVEAIKAAILQAQYSAAKSANAQQLQLYYAVGGYISANTRNGTWGTGALKVISEQLKRALPGLRGFSERNLKYMRTFFEEWAEMLDGGLPRPIRQSQLPNRTRKALSKFGSCNCRI